MPCQEASAAALNLSRGASVTTCEIYLLPQAVTPVFVAFKGDDATNKADVVWKLG
ncbi:hypothetical protein LN042_36420 [Kitasatospora sp. RB6PN24]|uniref:hypothetical protein n=1 Tax=Kitasatospora humi TaxID=2893891 RepID=UPI001E4A2E37|nr:hypothetical protein [Kitasatospora humi]MCC9312477.1 hypothetical protein [Kitasatospora humi]